MRPRPLLTLLAGTALTLTARLDAQYCNSSGTQLWSLLHYTSGASITIPAGQVYYLDIANPAQVDVLTIYGTLRFGCQDAVLRVDHIAIQNGGKLEIGWSSSAYLNRATILLTDTAGTSDTKNRTLSVYAGGTLDLHGKPVTYALSQPQPWVSLGATATAASNTIYLDQPVGWKVLDRIVVSSTDFDQLQAEEFVITAVSANKRTLTLDHALAYTHWGVFETGVDERAQVALLNRNVVIRSDATTAGTGGHIEILATDASGNPGPTPTTHIQWTEFTNLGRQNGAGDPITHPSNPTIHWDGLGSASGSYIKYSSLHHNNYLGITIEDTSDLTVDGNVSHDTYSHAYYLDDETSVHNVLTNNLGMVCRKLQNGPDSNDAIPSVYWIDGADNTITDCVAAGSDWNGFSFNKDNNTAAFAFPTFARNTSHSNGQDGFWSDHRWVPVDKTIQYSMPDFTSYKNRRRGLTFRTEGKVTWSNVHLADNASGVWFAAKAMTANTLENIQTLDHGIVIGESGNVGNPPAGGVEADYHRTLPQPNDPELGLSAFEVYDGLVVVNGTNFKSFETTNWSSGGHSYVRNAALFWTVRFQTSPYAIDPRNQVTGLTLTPPISASVKFENGLIGDNSIHNTILFDLDGSNHVVANNPFLLPVNGSTFNPIWNAYVVPYNYQGQITTYGQLTIVQNTTPRPTYITIASTTRANAHYDIYPVLPSAPKMYPTNLILGDEYDTTLSPSDLLSNFDVWAQYGLSGSFIVSFPYIPEGPATLEVNGISMWPSLDLNALRNSTDGLHYYFQPGTNGGRLYLKPVFIAGTPLHIIVRPTGETGG